MNPTIKNWLPALVWASLILMASSDMFSAAHTRSLIEGFFGWLFPSWSPHSIYKVHLVVRKCAHFFEYAVLAIFVMRGIASGAKAPFEAAVNGAGEPAPRPSADPSTGSTASRSLGITSVDGASNGAGEPAPRPKPRSLRMTMVAVVLLCATVATIDEVHQHFVPSRTSSPYDVMLDTTGAAVAMLLLTWWKSSRSAEQKTA